MNPQAFAQRHCNLPHAHAKGNERKTIKAFIVHLTLQALAWQSFFMKYFYHYKSHRHVGFPLRAGRHNFIQKITPA
jgi:hypothetical protein